MSRRWGVPSYRGESEGADSALGLPCWQPNPQVRLSEGSDPPPYERSLEHASKTSAMTSPAVELHAGPNHAKGKGVENIHSTNTTEVVVSGTKVAFDFIVGF
ncbi:hypothetical protein CDL15_Pgr003955 [Punica granatum]|uniref:Uncharacterized protein n=1 Tax=Punica granatum TaxID=22663 RepID=A0A218WR60_PUNGR|nr:hypothetical protein CDL15_Pgr003955 [Punica granatum]